MFRFLNRRKMLARGGDGLRGGHGHRLGVAGNVVALAAVLVVCANGDLLLREQSEPEARPLTASRTGRHAAGGRVDRLVLVVIDGLRADVAFDPQQMPCLSRLAARHGQATARVECLIPSSIAGIATITTGRVPAPSSFLNDFRAPPAQQGGVLQAVAENRGRCFVAGPTLWIDLYRPWIATSEPDPTFGHRDRRLTAAAVDAIRTGEHQLVVLHLGSVDAAAHQFGSDSEEYAAAARRCDQALFTVDAALEPTAGLIVTSDHGNTLAGGHAGPEAAVLTTPLVIAGAGLPAVHGSVPQSHISELVAQSLGVADRMPERKRDAPDVGFRSPAKIGAIALAALGGLVLCSAVNGRCDGRRQAFALNIAVWLTVGLVLVDQLDAALLLGTAAFAATAISTGIRVSPTIFGCCVAGTAVGAVRIADGVAALSEWPEYAGAIGGTAVALAALLGGCVTAQSRAQVRLPAASSLHCGWLVAVSVGLLLAMAIGQSLMAAVFLLCVATGGALKHVLRLTNSHAVGGAALILASVVLSRTLGETVSLSSIDVRAGFCVLEWPSGLLWACLTVIAGQAIPAAGLLLGSGSAIAAFRAAEFGHFVSGAAVVLLGQLVLIALVFASGSADQAIQALTLGLLIRVIAETSYLFIGLLCILQVRRFRKASPVIAPC